MAIMSNYLLKLLEKDERLDGRKLDEFRSVRLETGVIEKAEGSARVIMGNTDVMVGVKMNLTQPFADTPEEGVLMTNAEFSPIAYLEFLPGPPTEDAIELARVVDRGIRESHAIDLEKLCIEPGEKVWLVHVDIEIINHDGNLIDASSLGAIAALLDAKIPKLEDDKIIREEKKEKLPVNHKPITVTVGKVLDRFIVDCTRDEEEILDSWLSVGIREDGKICSMQKGGKGSLSSSDVDKIMEIALNKSKELRKLLK